MLCDHFELPADSYVRDMNVMKHAISAYVFYLNKLTGRTIDECHAYVKKALGKGGRFEFKDPKARYAERQPNGDRIVVEGGLWEYIKESLKKEEVLVGTFTTYVAEKVLPSKIGKFIGENIKLRSVAKHRGFKAKMEGDIVTEIFCRNEQVNKKVFNNSCSGAHASEFNILHNPTAHSSLTSNCRMTAGYGNANNEKFLAGNRHYHNYEVTQANLIACSLNADLPRIEMVLEKYSLVAPTAEETMECIKYSADMYWENPELFKRLSALVIKLTPAQRAAFVYSGDFHHLAKLNPTVMRDYLGRLSEQHTGVVDDPESIAKNADSDILNLAVQICRKVARGKQLFKATAKKDKLISEQGINDIACTIINIYKVLDEYKDLLNVFFASKIMPSSLARFPTSVRRVVVLSDTDSTIFTVKHWVKWFTGKIGFDDQSQAIAASMIFMSAKTITHLLSQMSINVGVDRKRIKQIAMKNEFKFDVFIPTLVAKHYFAIKDYQEGNLFDEHELEIKGVHLKSSNAAPGVMELASGMMKDIMMSVYREEPLDLRKYLHFVSNIEHSIYDTFARGESDYFKPVVVKTPESYKQGWDTNALKHHAFWIETFGKYYGDPPPFPYFSYKVNTPLNNKTETDKWLESLENKELAKDIRARLAKTGRKHLPTLHLPETALTNGMPAEVLSAVNARSIITDSTNVFYLILASLGFHLKRRKKGTLLSDFYDKTVAMDVL